MKNIVTYITRTGDYDLGSQYAKNRKKEEFAKKANDLINDRTYKELLLKNKQEQDILESKLKELLKNYPYLV